FTGPGGGIAPAAAQESAAPSAGVPAAPRPGTAAPAEREPKMLRRPLETPAPEEQLAPSPEALTGLYRTPMDPPLGFTGPSGIVPRERQETAHFVPIEDRWRLGFPAWDRYDKGHPLIDDYPYVIGNILNSYKQNVLKGDYPIIGQ